MPQTRVGSALTPGSSGYELGRSTATATSSGVVGRSNPGGVSGRIGGSGTCRLLEEFDNYGQIGARRSIKKIPIRIKSSSRLSIRRDSGDGTDAGSTMYVHGGGTGGSQWSKTPTSLNWPERRLTGDGGDDGFGRTRESPALSRHGHGISDFECSSTNFGESTHVSAGLGETLSR